MARLKCCYGCTVTWGLSSATISSLHDPFHPPEMEINPWKMVCDCPCDGTNKEILKMATHTILSPAECVCQCTIAYALGDPLQGSAGEYYNNSNTTTTTNNNNTSKVNTSTHSSLHIQLDLTTRTSDDHRHSLPVTADRWSGKMHSKRLFPFSTKASPCQSIHTLFWVPLM